jgi:signal transduction histidine kinase/HPt (histidine-containing phosphotransfer) domain-containing protein/ActR/RegA family two-component response regulator
MEAKQDSLRMLGVLTEILENINAYVAVSDTATGEFLFANRMMRDVFGVNGDLSGLHCWEVIQLGMNDHCQSCKLRQLKNPASSETSAENQSSRAQRYFSVLDSVIRWTDGKKAHAQFFVDVSEMRAEHQMTENSRRVLSNILDGLDAFIYVSDMETNEILFVNRSMKDGFGLPDDIIGQPCWKALGCHDKRCSPCPVDELSRNPAMRIVNEQYCEASQLYQKHVDSVIEWIDGKQVHLKHSVDISDLLEAQQAVHDARERLELALNASRAGVWQLDMSTRLFSYDELCAKMFGLNSGPGSGILSLDELAAHLESLMADKYCESIRQDLESAEVNAAWPTRIIKLVFENGETRYIRSYGDAVRDDEGRVQRVVGMNMDITQTVNLENALKEATIHAENKGREEADERTQIMLDATPLASSFWDEDGNILDCNQMAVRLFELDNKEEFIQHFHDLSPEYQPDGQISNEKLMREISLTLETGQRHFDWMHLTKAGAPLPVEQTVVRVQWKGGHRLTAYSRDMREFNALQREWVQAVERSTNMELQAKIAMAASLAKRQFLSNMAHEIRTPMNAIVGMSDLLANEALNERQASYVNDIRISSNALLRIINDILDFSKIEAGKLQLSPVDYDIGELLHNVESMFTFSAQKKGIAFQMRVLQNLPPCLYGDDIRVRQILVNVLGNAIKFTRQGGITLTVEIADDNLCFDVADSGVGIREEDIPKIFGEFDQLDANVNRNITGTGLGLAITKNLVAIMGGTISADSVYGEGTVFHIQLPLVLGNREKMRKSKKDWQPIHAPEALVLVVDDNQINLNVAVGLLSLSGIKCDTAQSGAEAIRMAENRKYDIIFMDHMMPEMDGVEATGKLREHHDMNELVIVALTANAVEGVRETLLAAQMNDYLSKPIDKEQLNQVLLKWLPAGKVSFSASVMPEPSAELSPFLTEVAAVDGVDVALGLDQIGGLQDAYSDSLRILTRRLPEVSERLEGFLAEGDLKGFSIEVHGLKGSLANIGGKELAKKAETLELGSKAGDENFVRENLAELRTGMHELEDALAAAEEKTRPSEAEKPMGDPDALAQSLTLARELLEAFENDEALALIQEQIAYDYGEATNTALQKAARKSREFAFDEAIEIIDKLLGGA